MMHFVATKVQVQLCVVCIGVKRHAVLDSPVSKVRHVQDEEQRTSAELSVGAWNVIVSAVQ